MWPGSGCGGNIGWQFSPPNGYPENFHYKSVNEITDYGKGGPDTVISLKGLPIQKILTKTNYKPYADHGKDLQLQNQKENQSEECIVIKKHLILW